MIGLLGPDAECWPAVRVVSTTRVGGVSIGPWAGLNLALHVGDEPGAVLENRRLLRAAAGYDAEPLWLEQVHGVEVVTHQGPAAPQPADAAVAFERNRVCAVLTADCLPVVFTDRDSTRVAVAHAGWRGLAAGVLEATIKSLGCDPGALLAWMGPAIGPAAFEVGEEVREAFVQRCAAHEQAFVRNEQGRWQADLYVLARRTLANAGVAAVSGGGLCTHADPERFYSYRRDGRTGRMATLAWLP